MPRQKRQSAPRRDSSSRSLPDLFLDRSLGRYKVALRLRQAHPRVITHDELFAQDTDDELWLSEAGRRRWIVLTRDDHIRYRPGEQRILVSAGVRCFCLHPTKGLTGDEMAEAFAKALHRILQIAEENPVGGYVKRVSPNGQVRDLFP